MSIWCSGRTIGYDDWPDENDEMTSEVRSYATGWSNHYPTTDGDVERPASINTAYLPPYCVPGHSEDWYEGQVGPWLRLCVDGWKHDYYNPTNVVDKEYASVVLDVKAVESLVHDLTFWLSLEKIYPTESEPA